MKAKTLVTIALFVAWAITVAILVAGLLFANQSRQSVAELSPGEATKYTALFTLTPEIVAFHNNLSDCWIIIGNTVYDVTTFLSAHPGGQDMILPYCGTYADEGFNTKGKIPGILHSAAAQALLLSYFIGDLGQAPVSGTTQFGNNRSSTNMPASPNQGLDNASPEISAGVTLSLGTVAFHNRESDCWIVINNKVYDVTSFLPNHPGAASAIIPYCGTYADEGFNTKGKIPGVLHSAAAQALLSGFYLGDLNQNIIADVLSQRVNTSQANARTSGSREYEDDEREDD